MHNLKDAIKQWRLGVRTTQIITDPEILQPYGTASYKTTHQVSAIHKPDNKAQVQEIVKVAGYL